ncbi:MAG: AtpZ/AtpI family protein [bacterium]
MSQNKQDRGILREILAASQVGINMVVSTFVGLAMGYGLDKLLKTSPWFTLIFLILGIISGFIQLFRTAAREAGKNGKENL